MIRGALKTDFWKKKKTWDSILRHFLFFIFHHIYGYFQGKFTFFEEKNDIDLGLAEPPPLPFGWWTFISLTTENIDCQFCELVAGAFQTGTRHICTIRRPNQLFGLDADHRFDLGNGKLWNKWNSLAFDEIRQLKGLSNFNTSSRDHTSACSTNTGPFSLQCVALSSTSLKFTTSAGGNFLALRSLCSGVRTSTVRIIVSLPVEMSRRVQEVSTKGTVKTWWWWWGW